MTQGNKQVLLQQGRTNDPGKQQVLLQQGRTNDPGKQARTPTTRQNKRPRETSMYSYNKAEQTAQGNDQTAQKPDGTD